MRSERFQTKEKASIEVYGRSQSIIGDLKNVSKTGACVEWVNEGVDILKGDLIRMTVFLKTLNRKHLLSAEVVWRKDKAVGVNFIDPEKVLEKLVARSM